MQACLFRCCCDKETRKPREGALLFDEDVSHFSFEESQLLEQQDGNIRFDQLYRFTGEELGKGAFSTVKECQRIFTGQISAVKEVNRSKLGKGDEKALKDEIEILQSLREHAGIINMINVFEEPGFFFIVMEKVDGGELFDRIVQKEVYTEREARNALRAIFSALEYCHSQKIAHRDLKPENLLLKSRNDDSSIVLADFGFAKRVEKPNGLRTLCGTPGYVAPEILRSLPYDHRCDNWSMGVIAYILLSGYQPFYAEEDSEIFRKTLLAEYDFPDSFWAGVSRDAKNLIRRLLHLNTVERLSAEQVLSHKWMIKSSHDLASQNLDKNLTQLKKFNAKRKLRGMVKAVIATNKMGLIGFKALSGISV